MRPGDVLLFKNNFISIDVDVFTIQSGEVLTRNLRRARVPGRCENCGLVARTVWTERGHQKAQPVFRKHLQLKCSWKHKRWMDLAH